MRILNEQGEEITEEQADLTLGHIETEQLLVAHHEATDEVQEQTHWEAFPDYPNVKKLVVDVPYQPAKAAWNEYETIGRYKLYTEDELRANAATATEEAKTSQLSTLMLMAAPALAANLSDPDVQSVALLMDEWTVGASYKTGDVVRYKGGLWRALQGSTGESQYPPNVFTSGWKRIGEPNSEGVYPWSQPFGATDAYMKGDTVTYDDATWVSDIDNNVWAPGVYGWTKQDSGDSGDTGDSGDVETVAEWVQPTGAQDAYSKGVQVTHNGKTWTSDVDANVWEPGVYGWTETAQQNTEGETQA